MATTTYRRSGASARSTRDLVFDRLPPVVRDRLARCLAEGGAPAPLIASRRISLAPSPGTWRVIAAAALVAEVVVSSIGFADAGHRYGLQPLSFALIHGALAALFLFAVIWAARIAREQGGAPIASGRYLFALDLIEVQGRHLAVTALDGLRRIEARPGRRRPNVVLVLSDGHEIVFENQHDAEALARAAQRAVDGALDLILPDHQPRLERIDPFFELRLTDDWSSAMEPPEKGSLGTRIARAPAWAIGAAALAAGLVAGVGLLELRNRWSDDEMFALALEVRPETPPADRGKIGRYTGRRHAGELDALRFERAHGDEVALAAYVAAGGEHVEAALLELVDLQKHDLAALDRSTRRYRDRFARVDDALFEAQKGDLDALVGYVERGGARAEQADEVLFALAKKSGEAKSYAFYLKHGKRHAEEVRGTLWPDAAFAEMSGRSMQARLDFLRDHPDSRHAGAVKAQIHDLFTDSLAYYRAAEAPDGEAGRFVEAMLAYMDAQSDPIVIVDVHLGEGAALASADAALAARHGERYLPAAPSLDAETRSTLERQIADAIGQRLRTMLGGVVRPMRSDVEGDHARISVVCEPLASGTFAVGRSRRLMSSVRFAIDFQATIPGRSEHLGWKERSRELGSIEVDSDPLMDDIASDDRGSRAYGWMWEGLPREVIDRVAKRL